MTVSNSIIELDRKSAYLGNKESDQLAIVWESFLSEVPQSCVNLLNIYKFSRTLIDIYPHSQKMIDIQTLRVEDVTVGLGKPI